MTREAWKQIGLTVAVIASAVVIGWLLLRLIQSSIEDHNRWVAWCGEQGGHVAEHTDTRTGLGTTYVNGHVGTTTTISSSTTYYCLSETGGILDIR